MFLSLVLRRGGVVPLEPMPMFHSVPVVSRSEGWYPRTQPWTPTILFQGCELFLWRGYKYRSDAISIPAPAGLEAGLEACPCRFLKLLPAHLDTFHPAFLVAQPVNRYVE